MKMNDLIDSYIDRSAWKVKENSNMAYSLQGMNNFVTSNIVSEYWLYEVYDRKIRKAHKDGSMHIHDLSTLGNYCCGWSLEDLLIKGFKGVSGKIESNPPKHFSTALMQIVNFMYTLAGELAGAIALNSLDVLLAPFIRYDKLTDAEVKQELQMFLYNLNVPTRTGFQQPFSNLTLDLSCPEHLKVSPIIIGGEEQDTAYGEYQKEIDLINRTFAELFIEGDATQRPLSFPVITYNITKDFDWDNKNLDAIWEMTAKRGTPYFANFVNSDMDPSQIKSMCCRLSIKTDELKKRGGGLFGADPLTGSLGNVTINMNQLGYLSKDKPDFFRRLTRVMDLAKESLILKREKIEELTKYGLYPYSKFYLTTVCTRFGQYWKNHFNTIGILGMNDAIYTMFDCTIGDKIGIDFTKEVMNFMNNKLLEYQEETGDLFNLESSPAESTSFRLAKIDRKQFPDIKIYSSSIANIENEYYCNSTQLPPGYSDNIQECLDKQDEILSMYTGGSVNHVFMGEAYPDPIAVKNLVKRIAMNYHLPYFSITPTFSICPTHGYLGGSHKTCPVCGSECEIYSRIVGYYRPLSQWNDGKIAEYNDRKLFKI